MTENTKKYKIRHFYATLYYFILVLGVLFSRLLHCDFRVVTFFLERNNKRCVIDVKNVKRTSRLKNFPSQARFRKWSLGPKILVFTPDKHRLDEAHFVYRHKRKRNIQTTVSDLIEI